MRKPLIIAFLFYVLVNGLDIASSYGTGPGFSESNPYHRNSDHSFNVYKSFFVKSFGLLFISAFSGVIYLVFRPRDTKLAEIAASIPFLFVAADVLFFGVANNILLRMGFYVP